MMTTKHIAETDLALYVSGDLSLLQRALAGLHVSRCERCRRRAEVYRADRQEIRKVVAEMPEGLDWDRLAAEMTANIRVGLAAGECVAPRKRKVAAAMWRPAAVMAGLALVLASAWWLNMPPSTNQALGRAFSSMWHARSPVPVGINEDRGMMVEATSAGIELHENGNSLGVSQGTARPVGVSVSVEGSQGSASARYVNADTGQMTITSVYAQ